MINYAKIILEMDTNFMTKKYLTINQQMRHLRDDKQIDCRGSNDKTILIRAGYFNLVNGYKNPFTTGKDKNGNHMYLKGTTLQQIYEVKKFDDELRLILLKYLVKAEEEVRVFTGYIFDRANKKGAISWDDVDAYDKTKEYKDLIEFIATAYNQISRNEQEYIKFYQINHKKIPTWILIKVLTFSTFIKFIDFSKTAIKDELCSLYGIPNHKLLFNSLNLMRKIRNSCAHNERVFCFVRKSGRINETYMVNLGNYYKNRRDQKLIDLIIFVKYYLQPYDYKIFINNIKIAIIELQKHILPMAFDKIRADLGLKDINDLDKLIQIDHIKQYNKFN